MSPDTSKDTDDLEEPSSSTLSGKEAAEAIMKATASVASRQTSAAVASSLWRLLTSSASGSMPAEKSPDDFQRGIVEKVVDRLSLVAPSLTAQVVAGTRGGEPHSAHGLVPHDDVLNRNVALHAGFSTIDRVSELTMSQKRSLQRGRTKITSEGTSGIVSVQKAIAGNEKNPTDEDTKKSTEQIQVKLDSLYAKIDEVLVKVSGHMNSVDAKLVHLAEKVHGARGIGHLEVVEADLSKKLDLAKNLAKVTADEETDVSVYDSGRKQNELQRSQQGANLYGGAGAEGTAQTTPQGSKERKCIECGVQLSSPCEPTVCKGCYQKVMS